MSLRDDSDPPPERELAPKRGLQLMAIIVLVLALLAIYSNLQRWRRANFETVTVIPAAASPTPAAP
ncbi:MAG: hypothetical protein M3Y03_00155 [Verrucomicrobiota bacterium]|nr:hypothetical protein [Verrucomicrobiota bacterium]